MVGRLLALCCGIIFAGSSCWAAGYSTTNLGVLGSVDCGGGVVISYSKAAAISSSGQIVGKSMLSSGEAAVFCWSEAGGMTQVGNLSGVSYEAGGISDTGKVILNRSYYHGYYDLTTGSLTSTADYIPVAINAAGRLCANYESGGYHFPRYRDGSGSWTSIGDLPGYPLGSMTAMDMNGSGQICGIAVDAANQKRSGFFWSGAGNLVDLGVPDGYTFTSAVAINDNGWVVGSASYLENSEWRYDPFLWRLDSGFTFLSSHAGSKGAVGINNLNQVIGTSGGTSWVWSAGKGFTTLGNLAVTGINDDGWIVGTGKVYSGKMMEDRALLLRPVPEPSSLAAILCGLCGLGGWRHRRRVCFGTKRGPVA